MDFQINQLKKSINYFKQCFQQPVCEERQKSIEQNLIYYFYNIWYRTHFKKGIKHHLFKILSLFYILAMVSVRSFRLVRWIFSLAFRKNQSLKMIEGSGVLFLFWRCRAFKTSVESMYYNIEIMWPYGSKDAWRWTVFKLQFLSFWGDLLTLYLKVSQADFLMILFMYNEVPQALKNVLWLFSGYLFDYSVISISQQVKLQIGQSRLAWIAKWI